MSRITGNDAKGLMEAYGAVYQPKQLTEEQVWEGVEKWVNALVEEGYDLSDYTWEEAYEAYFQLDEVAPLAIPAAMAAAPYVLPALGAATYAAKEFMNRRKTKSQEPVDYGQTSFAASKEAERRGKEAAELNRKQLGDTEKKDTPKPEEVAKREARQKIKIKKPQVDLPKPPETTPVQSSTSSTGNTGSATGGSGGRKPKPEGPNWAQRQLTDIQRGRAQEKGAGTAERLGRVIGSGEKITKGSAEWAAKNLLAKPLGVLAGAGLVGTAGYGAYKGSEALIKQFGPGIMKWGKSVLTPNLQNNSYDMNRDEVIIECLNLIANHLIEGKYASNEKGALKIMENMSDGWALNILGNYLEE
jgi:hypothetical protein